MQRESDRANKKLLSLYAAFCDVAFSDEDESEADLATKVLSLEWALWCDRHQHDFILPLDKMAFYNLVKNQNNSDTIAAKGLSNETIDMVLRKKALNIK